MFEAIKRRPRRAVKAGVAAAVAVAAGGAFFASQAGAAPAPGATQSAVQDVMIKTKQYVRCAYVYDFTAKGQTRHTGRYDYNDLHWNPQAYNSTGILAVKGDYVQVWLSYSACGQKINGYTVRYNVGGPGAWGDAWADTTTLPVLDDTSRRIPQLRQPGAAAGSMMVRPEVAGRAVPVHH